MGGQRRTVGGRFEGLSWQRICKVLVLLAHSLDIRTDPPSEHGESKGYVVSGSQLIRQPPNARPLGTFWRFVARHNAKLREKGSTGRGGDRCFKRSVFATRIAVWNVVGVSTSFRQGHFRHCLRIPSFPRHVITDFPVDPYSFFWEASVYASNTDQNQWTRKIHQRTQVPGTGKNDDFKEDQASGSDHPRASPENHQDQN